tara:strand:+ start:393 stop:1196 length:804 start_codon:yes stop_codon:yes gene_type:complete
MPFIAANGIQLYYEMEGDGSPLLIISGTGADLRNPRPKNPHLNGFRVLRYDQRGLGQTASPKANYTMADYADDAASLLDSLEIDHINVIGISFGGMVAQQLVTRFPNKVNKLVLACTSPGGNNFSSFDLREIVSDSSNKIETWLKILDSRYKSSDENLPILNMIKDALNANTRLFPHLVTDGLSRQLEARSQHDCRNTLRNVSHQTLIVGGRYDDIAPLKNLLEIHRLLKNSQLQIFEGGHLFLMQDKQAWPAIISFLLSESDTLKA